MTTWRDSKTRPEPTTAATMDDDSAADDDMALLSEEDEEEILLEEEILVIDDEDGSEIEVLLEEEETEYEEVEYIVEEEEVIEDDDDDDDNNENRSKEVKQESEANGVVVMTDVDSISPPPEKSETAERVSYSAAGSDEDEPDEAATSKNADADPPLDAELVAAEQRIEETAEANTNDSFAVSASNEAEPQAATNCSDVSVADNSTTISKQVVGGVTDAAPAAPAIDETMGEDQPSSEEQVASSSNIAEDESTPSVLSVETVEEKSTEEDGVDSTHENEKPVAAYLQSSEEDVEMAAETPSYSKRADGPSKPLVENNETTENERSAPGTSTVVAVKDPKEADPLAEENEQESHKEVDEQQSASKEAEPPVAPTDSNNEPKPSIHSGGPESPHSRRKIPIPAAAEKEIGWEKPDWVKQSPLKSKKGKVNAPVGSPEKKIEWEKPRWVQAKLKPTGKDVKKGIDLQSPITHVPKEADTNINLEANPLVLKPTEKGTAVRLGENLAMPITFINGKEPAAPSAA